MRTDKIMMWLSVGSALIAALLWLKSATCQVVKRASDITEAERGIWLFTRREGFRENPFLSAKLQNAWSGAAAIFAAFASVFQALSSAFGP